MVTSLTGHFLKLMIDKGKIIQIKCIKYMRSYADTREQSGIRPAPFAHLWAFGCDLCGDVPIEEVSTVNVCIHHEVGLGVSKTLSALSVSLLSDLSEALS